MQPPSRAAEQARMAARVVLANLESLDLPDPQRERVSALARVVCRWNGEGPQLDDHATRAAVREIRAVVSTRRTLAARCVVEWLDEALTDSPSRSGRPDVSGRTGLRAVAPPESAEWAERHDRT